MDQANLAAAWVSAAVTAIGLTSLVAQINNARSALDPFNKCRDAATLGEWAAIQEPPTWYPLSRTAPVGPVLASDLTSCLGVRVMHLTRRPACAGGRASWTLLLTCFHPNPVRTEYWRQPGDQRDHHPHHHPHLPHLVPGGDDGAGEGKAHALAPIVAGAHGVPEAASSSSSLSPSLSPSPSSPAAWRHSLATQDLLFSKGSACATMSRITFITFVLLSQAVEIFRYNEAAGLRLGLASYNGIWRIDWPLGHAATLHFEPQDSYAHGTDSFPPSYSRSPEACIEMCVGIVHLGPVNVKTGLAPRTAFAGRKRAGRYALRFLRNRFGAQRSAVDLYNKMGGTVHGVDYFLLSRLDEAEDVQLQSHNQAHISRTGELAPSLISPYTATLSLPALDSDRRNTVYLTPLEVANLRTCLDYVPLSYMGWSIHRGMKDILTAFASPVLKLTQNALAAAFKKDVEENQWAYVRQGWSQEFVMGGHMAEAAVSSIGDDTCSGDVCRIICTVARSIAKKVGDEPEIGFETKFWRETAPRLVAAGKGEEVGVGDLNPDAVVALTKVLMVKWSLDFDYELYHVLPAELIVA